MAIIYTYPVKTSPVAADKVLISDSEDNNKTKSVTIDDIRGATASGVSSIIAGTSNVTLPTGQTGDVTISVSGSADAVVETVRNNSGVTIEKGQPLHITGVNGTTPTVEVADASNSAKMPVSGLAKEQILNNADGEMIISGILEGIDTANIDGSPAEAAVVYVNTTTGGSIDFLSANAPTTEANLIQNIGIVVKSSPGTSGSIQVTAIGRTNAAPNLNQGSIFIGNGTNQPTTLAIGANTYVLTSNGTTASWAAAVDTNTNIANTNLQINTASRTLDLNNNSLTIIDTSTGASKNLFKFDQPGGTVPEFTVGSAASGYEGNITLEGNDASRTGTLKFKNATGDYSTTIKANALQATNLNYVLPLTQTGNGILTNNGTGTLSWSTSISPTEIIGSTSASPATFAATPYRFDNTNGGSGIGAPLATQVASGFGNKHISFFNGGVFSGGINQSGASSVNYATSSDYRLKENVVEMTGAVDRIKQLNPSRFNFIADGPSRTVDGFLAHEVSSVVPEAITGEKDAVDAEGNIIAQGIDQSKLVPLLVGAIKELTARIEALEA